MIRDILTATIVSLTLVASASAQESDSLGLQLMAATGDVRRSLIQFLDLYAGLKAGAHRTLAEPAVQNGWATLAAQV